METHMLVRLVVGLTIAVVGLAIAGRRVFFLYRMIAAGQPSPGRLDAWPKRLVGQVVEVFGQARLLKWNVPGIAHFFVFWGFIILTFTIIEAFGALFDADFHIPLIGKSPVLGFLEDFFGVAVLLGLIAFGVSCHGLTPVLSCAARIPNIVKMTRKIIPRTTQAAVVCEP